MDNRFIKIISSKSTLSIFGLFYYIMCFGQLIPNLEGYYYFKENSAGVYIYDQNKFLVVGYGTAVKGTIEIINNEVEFKSDHPNSELLLFGRKTLGEKQIIFENNLFRNKLSLGKPSHNNDQISLYDISPEENDYCTSNQYFLPLSEIPTSIFF
ncbi:hypothetical protein [Chryseobacterium oryctis]|uniref:DKNYY family protein n=1 Tax=Chryseobacterium oryctis TaxID=2952618 RepID=A0ABT3HP47_9FLAO|nr:hypothetical protein [Chryseobacterium oryctis]MCW3161524.1 hypothetical protein [Chryseobacterium oryctis]